MKDRLFSTVISGKLKHKKIFLPDLSTTRSTKNIIRAAIFNSIVGDIYGSLFVELFAGSGSMGIEAISRGAVGAVFVEKDRLSFACLKENLANMHIMNECKLFNADTFLIYDDVLKYAVSSSHSVFLYFDPPFDIRDGMEDVYKHTLELISKTPPQNIKKIFFEHISSFEAPEAISDFVRVKVRKFGKTTVSEYIPQ